MTPQAGPCQHWRRFVACFLACLPACPDPLPARASSGRQENPAVVPPPPHTHRAPTPTSEGEATRKPCVFGPVVGTCLICWAVAGRSRPYGQRSDDRHLEDSACLVCSGIGALACASRFFLAKFPQIFPYTRRPGVNNKYTISNNHTHAGVSSDARLRQTHVKGKKKRRVALPVTIKSYQEPTDMPAV